VGRPKLYDDDLRDRLLERAAQIISDEGVGGLSLRKLAQLEGTSTSAVYAFFGGKEGLLGALFVEGYEDFTADQTAVPRTEDVIADLRELARRYWEWGTAHPNLYRIMFAQSVPEYAPTLEQAAISWKSIVPMQSRVDKAVKDGIFLGDPRMIGFVIWSSIHGVTSLSNDMGALYRDASFFEATFEAVVRGLMPPSALS
jgi:AcrR family transcriptional regulator